MKKSFLLTAFSCITAFAFASHLRCGYITAEKSDCGSRTYTVTVTAFTNTGSSVSFGGDGILDFGDGTSMLIPESANVPRPDLGPNVGIATFTINHTYPAFGQYLISYVEPNRNGGVLNMNNSFLTTFYTETLISTDLCSTPAFTAPPVFAGFEGNSFSLALGAASSDDTQLTYEIVTPFRDRATPVDGFILPQGIAINYLTGLLAWDMAETDFAIPGEYNFAVMVTQWTRDGESWHRKQHARVDFQVILSGDSPEDFSMSDNQLPDPYKRIAIAAGEAKTIKVFYEIDNQYQPELELFSALPQEALSFTTYDSVSESSGKDIQVGKLMISPRAEDIRASGYVVTVRGSHAAGSLKVSSDLSYLVYTANELPPLPNPIITATEDNIGTVQVYPNPVGDFLQIDMTGSGSSAAMLYTAQGVLLKSHRFENRATIDTRNLPAGIYICDVRRNNVSVKKIKIIKPQ